MLEIKSRLHGLVGFRFVLWVWVLLYAHLKSAPAAGICNQISDSQKLAAAAGKR